MVGDRSVPGTRAPPPSPATQPSSPRMSVPSERRPVEKPVRKRRRRGRNVNRSNADENSSALLELIGEFADEEDDSGLSWNTDVELIADQLVRGNRALSVSGSGRGSDGGSGSSSLQNEQTVFIPPHDDTSSVVSSSSSELLDVVRGNWNANARTDAVPGHSAFSSRFAALGEPHLDKNCRTSRDVHTSTSDDAPGSLNLNARTAVPADPAADSTLWSTAPQSTHLDENRLISRGGLQSRPDVVLANSNTNARTAMSPDTPACSKPNRTNNDATFSRRNPRSRSPRGRNTSKTCVRKSSQRVTDPSVCATRSSELQNNGTCFRGRARSRSQSGRKTANKYGRKSPKTSATDPGRFSGVRRSTAHENHLEKRRKSRKRSRSGSAAFSVDSRHASAGSRAQKPGRQTDYAVRGEPDASSRHTAVELVSKALRMWIETAEPTRPRKAAGLGDLRGSLETSSAGGGSSEWSTVSCRTVSEPQSLEKKRSSVFASPTTGCIPQ